MEIDSQEFQPYGAIWKTIRNSASTMRVLRCTCISLATVGTGRTWKSDGGGYYFQGFSFVLVTSSGRVAAWGSVTGVDGREEGRKTETDIQVRKNASPVVGLRSPRSLHSSSPFADMHLLFTVCNHHPCSLSNCSGM
eukprot:5839729-Pyramimonas_sp.AAC.2